jgi:hypothetical protein
MDDQAWIPKAHIEEAERERLDDEALALRI